MMNWPSDYGRIILEEAATTMVEAASRASDAPIWVLAKRQSAGTGRRGRAWQMPLGNFAATLALKPSGSQARWALRSFVMAMALHDALVEMTAKPALFSLKWPNDVLCRGQKLAGILLESRGDTLLIGVGVNLVATPPVELLEDRALPPVDLKSASGQHVLPEAFLESLALHFARREERFTTEGFDRLRQDWLAHAARLGETIYARAGETVTTGRFDGIDSEGALLLSTPKGITRLHAADVYFE
ncbi:biotin--[acetyl-CoA-carboxylase] ligase [Pontivivens insulae]|uniref:biotin--[biotin carboxyl-carrier protein] ligase n=1 Tax=Pontivivens insulae TaxID=1639689 RepID=A0A2R8ACA9_9RHOB|nr:biotin--[acetyl-CoA-carboxylase] ligase [Pontivivens insulae]RED13780.1 BirA family biotin operon repressor/biotin-[acetyl-CoA-carboxylase] ligase [Pontivivens insulae]SPF29854.1 Bifunctional ligase/repressor BirA [Pontivivens insulae]